MSNKITNDVEAEKSSGEMILKIKMIKNIQSLPEEVVIKFIESKGKLIRMKKGKLKIASKIK
ncbi:MAG: hypothetical protein MZV64_21090 [Ignavibacteriales bacterium]|nr:hypothetical protein [Ignavibacteriales bacterium]